MTMAVVAGGHFRRHVRSPESHGLAVISISIVRQAVLMTPSAPLIADRLEVAILRLLNLVRGMAIRADRAPLVALGQDLAVDAWS